MKKRWTSLILAVAIVVQLIMPAIPQVHASQSAGGDIFYDFDYGSWTLTLTGSGPMQDYRSEAPWKADPIYHVVIGEGITYIGYDAFGTAAYDYGRFEGYVKTVSLPSTLNEIGRYAFVGNPDLKEIDLPEGLVTIGEGAFSSCGLREVTLPTTLKTLGNYAFNSCVNLTKIVIPASVTSIGQYAFSSCSSKLVIYGYEDSYAKTYAEERGITFQVIKEEVFEGTCGDDARWSFADGVLTITGTGYISAGDWTHLKFSEVIIGEGIECVDYNTFNSEVTGCQISKVTLPSTLKVIVEDAFYGNASLTSVEFPEGLESIYDRAFYGCGLTEVVIPESVYLVSIGAFAECKNLSKAVIPASVQYMGRDAFAGCADNFTIHGYAGFAAETYANENNIPFVDLSVPEVFEGTCGYDAQWRIADGVLTITGTGDFYAGDWEDYEFSEVIIGEGIEIICARTFDAEETGCQISKVTLPSTLKEISEYAFRGNTGLTGIELPEGLDLIGGRAFYGCGLTEIVIPESVTSVDYWAFADCENLSKAEIPASLEGIAYDAFENCADDFTIYGYAGSVAESIATEYNYNFVDLSGPKEDIFEGTCGDGNRWTVSDGVLNIIGNGYLDVGNWDDVEFSEVVISEGFTYIGHNVFNAEESGRQISKVTLPSTVQQIGNSAFYGNESLTSIELPESLEEIYGSSFYGCGLTEVVIPESVYSVGFDAFADCKNLSKVVFKTSSLFIFNGAFTSCASDLTIYGYGGSYAEVYANQNNIPFVDLSGPKAPAAPAGFAAEVTESGIQLCWDAGSAATITGYEIHRSAGNEENFQCIATVDAATTAYNDNGLADAETYYYRIYAVWSEGLSEYAQTSKAIPDRTAPVISSLAATPNVCGGTKNPTITVTATDNVAVTRVEVSWSSNKTNYTQFDETASSWVWDISGLNSGRYWIKAVAYDAAGNASAESIITVDVDNSLPGTPDSFTVEATAEYIHLKWAADSGDSDAMPKDIRYEVYRAESADGPFEKIKSTYDLEYYDQSKNLDADATYYYYVVAVDQHGNTSEKAQVLSAQLQIDRESPVIWDMTPAEGSTICKETELQVSATDNCELNKAVFYYLDGEEWVEIGTDTAADNTVFTVKWNIPESIVGSVKIKAEVYDANSNNKPAEQICTVNVLTYQEPQAPEISVEEVFGKATIRWSYDRDLAVLLNQFVVYRTNEAGTNPVQVATVKRGTSGSYTVNLGYEEKAHFVIAAVDYFGASAATEVIAVQCGPDTEMPDVNLRAGAKLASVGQEIVFTAGWSSDNDMIAAYSWDFDGDGKEDSAEEYCTYAYEAEGTYTVSLTVRDRSGNASTATETIEVFDTSKEDSEYTKLYVTVKNNYAEKTPFIEDAEVFVTSAEDPTFEAVALTDWQGTAIFTVPRGSCTITVAADGYGSASRVMELDPVRNNGITIGLKPVDVSITDMDITVKEMTYEEILEAGIDVNAPGNEHVYEFRTEMTFVAGPGIKGMTVEPISFVNVRGEILNSLNNWFDVPLTEDEENNLPGGSGVVSDPKGFTTMGFFPMGRNYVLVVYGQAHWLKEMFKAELVVANNSYAEPITNCEATLSLPDGLSLADMIEKPQTLTVPIEDLAPKGSDEYNTAKVQWYIRGDKEGSYGLTATVNGMIGQDPFTETYSTDKIVEVYAGSALEMTVAADNHTFRDTPFHVTYSLKNVSDKPLYNLSFILDKMELTDVIHVIRFGTGGLETGRQTIQVKDIPQDGQVAIRELAPGEIVKVELFCRPLFLSVGEFVDIGPMEVAYYLTNILVVASDNNTTDIPVNYEYVKVTHGTLWQNFKDSVGDEIKDKVVNIVESMKDLDNLEKLLKAVTIYDFLTELQEITDDVPTLKITLLKSDGEFVSSPETTALFSGRTSGSTAPLKVYTDSEEYTVEEFDDYAVMTITGDAKVYVVNENPGDANLTMTTWAHAYEYNEQTGQMDLVQRDIQYNASFHVHQEVVQDAVDATCTSDGLTEGRYCELCSEVFAQQETIPSSGHSYENGICGNCGDTDPEYLQAPVITASNAAKTGYVKLTWNAVSGAAKYQIYRSTSRNGEYTLMYTTENTSYINTKATAGNYYYYYVVAINEQGIASPPSDIAGRTCDLPRPEVTTSNVARTGYVRLNWNAVEGAVKYKIYRSTERDGNYRLMFTTENTSYINTMAKAGMTYYYKVVAVAEKSAANSAASAVKFRTCDLPRPEVTASNVALTGYVKLDWNAVEGAVKYKIYRSTEKTGTYKLMFTTENTSYINTKVEAGMTYYYRVVAVAEKTAANSAVSKVVKIRTR